MIFKENFRTRLTDIGKDNKIKNKALLQILEDIGGYHSDVVGYGANDTLKNKTTWILLDWKLKVINRPKYGQTLETHTWVRDKNRFFTFRDYEIYDEKGNICAIATSKWTLVNIETGKMERITDDIVNAYTIEEKEVFPGERLEKPVIPKEFSNEIEYTVIRKDIDINKHMHNLYYLDLAYEALPEDVYNNRPYDNVRIMYKKEIKLGDTVICKYSNENDRHTVVITDKEENLHAIIEMKMSSKN